MKTRKYIVNDNYFEKIDTEEKAYWLGFISADGCVYTKKNTGSKILEIGLHIKDIAHLEKFKQSISSNHPIHKKEESCKITIVSKKIYNDLYKCGVTENKSKTLLPPSCDLIPNKYINHYVRGIFDGDGGFTKSDKSITYAVNFCGTPSICKFILEFLNCSHIKLTTKKDVEDFSEIRMKGNKQSLLIANIIYNNATIYLDRKFLDYLNLTLLNEINDILKELNRLEFKIKSIQMTSDLKKGLTGRQVADKYGYRETNITRYVKEYRAKESEDKKNKVLELYNQGIRNKSEIHRITGFSRDYIRKVFKQLN